ncbi:unnamed protein product [Ixodes hexagonus]
MSFVLFRGRPSPVASLKYSSQEFASANDAKCEMTLTGHFVVFVTDGVQGVGTTVDITKSNLSTPVMHRLYSKMA